MTFIVERIREQDKQDWLNLWHQADSWSLRNNRPDIPESNWNKIISGKNFLSAFGLRNKDDARLVGYILYRFDFCIKTGSDECFICDLFVAPRFSQKKGWPAIDASR